MQKGISTLIVIIIIIIVAVASAGGVLLYQYFTTQQGGPVVCTKETKACPDGSTVSRTEPNCEFALCLQSSVMMTESDWQQKLPEIKNLLIAQFPGERIGEEGSRPIGIVKNFYGKNINGAIVDLGVGGASTDENAIVIFVNGQLKVADVKEGDKSQNNFLAGGGVTHGSYIDVLSDDDKLLVKVGNWGIVGTSYSCDAKAYLWNSSEQSFIFDSENTTIIKTEYCNSIKKYLDQIK